MLGEVVGKYTKTASSSFSVKYQLYFIGENVRYNPCTKGIIEIFLSILSEEAAYSTLSEKIAHSTVFHHLSHLSVYIQ